MAHVRVLVCARMSETTVAFCVGEHLQHMTEGDVQASSRKSFWNESKQICRLGPSMTRHAPTFALNASSMRAVSRIDVQLRNWKIVWLRSIKRALMPMQVAVSALSKHMQGQSDEGEPPTITPTQPYGQRSGSNRAAELVRLQTDLP